MEVRVEVYVEEYRNPFLSIKWNIEIFFQYETDWVLRREESV